MHKTKDYERFKELYKDKNYALAYAMGIKYPTLQETPEYIKMENNFQISLQNAQKLILLNLPDQAKLQIQKYITVLSKRNILQLIINNDTNFKNFLKAYENNNFRICYEIMDLHKNIQQLKVASLLNQHWNKLLTKCELYSKEGDINLIIKTLGKLLLTSTRSNKIGDLLRNTFHIKITQLIDKENYISCEAIIYSYIDMFGIDYKIESFMKKFEKKSSITLAITQQKQKIKKDSWRDSEIIKSFDS